MRVILVNAQGTTATLQCITSGWIQRAHLNSVKFLKPPFTKALCEDWANIIHEEESNFQQLARPRSSVAASDVGSRNL